MPVKDILDRIEKRLEKIGKTATAASEEAGLSRDAIRNIRRGVRDNERLSVTTATLEALAPALNTSVIWLMGGDDNLCPSESHISSTDKNVIMAPVAGFVQAGVWQELEHVQDVELGRVPVIMDPRFKPEDHYVLKVNGDSFDKFVGDGGYVVCIPWERMFREPASGMPVIAEEHRDEGAIIRRTLKELALNDGGIFTLLPRSSNSAHVPLTMDDDTSVYIRALVIQFLQPSGY